jgi:hypothetical protein
MNTETNTPTLDQMRAVAEQAKTWLTVAGAAENYGVNPRRLHRAISSGEVICWRLNVLRVEPRSFAAWLAGLQK